MGKPGIFIAATGQDVGKTTLCLGILSGLQKRFPSVGFLKPVGQQYVQITNGTKVDKDVLLFKEYFNLSEPYEMMSPVVLYSGFTQDYLEGKQTTDCNIGMIEKSFSHISSRNNYTVVEGTGHTGVGSIVGLNNAQVAAKLGLDMVIISTGGLGRAFDELAMNIATCHQYGVKVKGIILNRVRSEKREKILNLFPKALEQWGIPLIGAVPYNELLSTPTMRDYEGLFKTKLLIGSEYRLRHFAHPRLVAASEEIYKQEIVPDELIITPACRHDIVKRILHFHRSPPKEHPGGFQGGLILTGQHPPTEETLACIRQCDFPVLYAPLCSYDAMKKITAFIAKIRQEDTSKIEQAIQLVETHIDFDLLCQDKELSLR